MNFIYQMSPPSRHTKGDMPDAGPVAGVAAVTEDAVGKARRDSEREPLDPGPPDATVQRGQPSSRHRHLRLIGDEDDQLRIHERARSGSVAIMVAHCVLSETLQAPTSAFHTPSTTQRFDLRATLQRCGDGFGVSDRSEQRKEFSEPVLESLDRRTGDAVHW